MWLLVFVKHTTATQLNPTAQFVKLAKNEANVTGKAF